MATTTTNFGWDIPQSTDLVKDGATAIAALGQDIDTALVDLKGGTTGQVLAKASATDLDYSWVAIDPLVILDAKGDLISATAADTPARVAVGTNGQVLTADSSTATGLKWAAPAAGGKVLQVVQGTTTTQSSNSTNALADTTLTATITPSASTSKILAIVSHPACAKSSASAGNVLQLVLLRGATTISTPTDRGLSNFPGSVDNNGGFTWSYLDSPSTTSATTYKTQFANPNNTASVVVQNNSGQSTIVLMEIGA